MSTVVVGAGPAGLVCAMALARQGRDVVLVDREPGPPPEGPWRRHGVMQFMHPHFFRSGTRRVLLDLLPDVWDALVAAGGIPALADGMPEVLTGLQCRRMTFERVLWQSAAREPGLTFVAGHADELLTERGRVAGVVVDGSRIDASFVVCATGRSSRFAGDVRLPGVTQSCGFSYVTRMYRARPGANVPEGRVPTGAVYSGYQAIVFPQDDQTLSALLVRPSTDDALAVRDNTLFDEIAQLVPQLAPWTEPASFEPITDVMVGGLLTNSYRSQVDEDGRAPLAGLVFLGDAVSTTNPSAGRGVSLGLQQAQVLVSLLADGADQVAERFDAWCTENIHPWYEDHVYWDAQLLRRFAGEDVDVEGRIPSDVICATATQDPSMMPVVGPFMGMLALPASLDAVVEQARAVLRTGWRPPYAEGPTRDELVERLGLLPVVPAQPGTARLRPRNSSTTSSPRRTVTS